MLSLTILMLVFAMLWSLLPSGRAAQKMAEDKVLAASFASGWLQEATVYHPDHVGMDRDQTVSLGREEYRARREFLAVSGQNDLLDVVVTLVPRRGPTVRMATRLSK